MERVKSELKSVFSGFHIGHGSFIGSSAIAQLFPIITVPIVSRLYTPSDFGVYAVFYAAATILMTISTMALTNAILTEETDQDASHAVLLNISVVVLYCVVLFGALAVLPTDFTETLIGKPVGPYLHWLPVTVFLSASENVLYTWCIRTDRFALLARNKLVLGVSTSLFQISVGFLALGASGFILANICGIVLSGAMLLAIFRRDAARLRPEFTVKSAWAQLVKHRELPLWTVPMRLINTMCQFMPDLLINRFFGAALTGQYSLANRTINFPLSFVSSSMQDIFYRQSTREFIDHGNCTAAFRRFFVILSVISIGVLVPIIAIVPYAFPLVMGEQWRQAGLLIQAIGPLLVIRFISSPLSYVWIVRKKTKQGLAWQVGLLTLIALTFAIPLAIDRSASLQQTLWSYSIGVGAWYVFCLLVSFRYANPAAPISDSPS